MRFTRSAYLRQCSRSHLLCMQIMVSYCRSVQRSQVGLPSLEQKVFLSLQASSCVLSSLMASFLSQKRQCFFLITKGFFISQAMQMSVSPVVQSVMARSYPQVGQGLTPYLALLLAALFGFADLAGNLLGIIFLSQPTQTLFERSFQKRHFLHWASSFSLAFSFSFTSSSSSDGKRRFSQDQQQSLVRALGCLQSLLGHSIVATSLSFSFLSYSYISLGDLALGVSHISQVLMRARLSNSQTAHLHLSMLAVLSALLALSINDYKGGGETQARSTFYRYSTKLINRMDNQSTVILPLLISSLKTRSQSGLRQNCFFSTCILPSSSLFFRYTFSQKHLWMMNSVKTIATVKRLRMKALMKYPSFFQSNQYVVASVLFIVRDRDCMRHRMLARVYMQTSISTSLTLGVWGIWSLMVGMKAMKARVRVATAAILPERAMSWKKMRRLMNPSTQRGRKMEMRLVPGYLYMGIRKCTYWKCLILWSSFFSFFFSGEPSSMDDFCLNISMLSLSCASLCTGAKGGRSSSLLRTEMGLKGFFSLFLYLLSRKCLASWQLPSLQFSLWLRRMTSLLVMQLNLMSMRLPSLSLGSSTTDWMVMVRQRLMISKGVQKTSPSRLHTQSCRITKSIILVFSSSLYTMPLSSLSCSDSCLLNCIRMALLPSPTNWSTRWRSRLPQQKEKRRVPEMVPCSPSMSMASTSLTLKRTQQGRQQSVLLFFSSLRTSLVENSSSSSCFSFIQTSADYIQLISVSL